MNSQNGQNNLFDFVAKVEGLYCSKCSVYYNNIQVANCYWCLSPLIAVDFYIASKGDKIGDPIIDTSMIGKGEVTNLPGKGKVIDDPSSDPREG